MSLLLLTLATAALQAQSSGEKFSLAGTVTNSMTGEPVRRALVTATCFPAPARVAPVVPGNLDRSALTDAAGRFAFEGVEAGNCSIDARKPSFRFSEGRLVLKIDRSLDNLALRLDPLPTVAGTVKDDRGEPWPGVQVEGFQVQYEDGRRSLHLLVRAISDDRGRFYFYEMPPGPHYFRAGGRPEITSQYVGQRRDTNVPIEAFRPAWLGGESAEAATPVTLVAGQRATVDFVLPVRTGYAVRGFLSNLEQYRPVRLELLRGDERLPFGAVTVNAASGEFRAYGLTDGAYVIRAVQGDASGEAAVNVSGADVGGVLIELAPAVPVRAVIRFEGPEWRPQQLPKWVSLTLRRQGLIRLRDDDGRLQTASFDQNGSARFDGVPAGRYRFTVAGPGYLASVALGQVDLLERGELTVPPGGLAEPIEVVMRNDGCRVSISLPEGVDHYLLVPDGGPASLQARRGRVWGEQKKANSVVAPGEYQVWTWSGEEDWESVDPEVLRARAVAGERFHASPNGQVEIVVRKNP